MLHYSLSMKLEKKKWLNKPRIDHNQQFIVRLHEVDKP